MPCFTVQLVVAVVSAEVIRSTIVSVLFVGVLQGMSEAVSVDKLDIPAWWLRLKSIERDHKGQVAAPHGIGEEDPVASKFRAGSRKIRDGVVLFSVCCHSRGDRNIIERLQWEGLHGTEDVTAPGDVYGAAPYCVC